MLNFLNDQLGQEYKVYLEKDKGEITIRIYHLIREQVDQENYVELNNFKDNNRWDLIIGQRDKRFLEGQYSKYNIGIFALFIFTIDKLGTGIANNDTRLKLIEIEETDIDLASNVIGREVSKKYYSFNKELKGAINLEPLGKNHYNIYYKTLQDEKINIIENRKAPNAFLVLYNFAIKLEHFDKVTKEWEKKINIDLVEKEEIKKYFLGQ